MAADWDRRAAQEGHAVGDEGYLAELRGIAIVHGTALEQRPKTPSIPYVYSEYQSLCDGSLPTLTFISPSSSSTSMAVSSVPARVVS